MIKIDSFLPRAEPKFEKKTPPQKEFDRVPIFIVLFNGTLSSYDSLEYGGTNITIRDTRNVTLRLAFVLYIFSLQFHLKNCV
jgi:hypothetical protein